MKVKLADFKSNDAEATPPLQRAKKADLSRFKVDPEDAGLPIVEEGPEKAAVSVGSPPKNAYIRVHPEFAQTYRVLIHPETEELYLTTEEIASQLEDDQWIFVTLRLCITKGKDVFIWAIKLSSPEYAASALTVANHAMKEWVRVFSRKFRAHCRPAKKNFGDPVWPTESPDELVEIAFGGRTVTSVDHEVVQRLEGGL